MRQPDATHVRGPDAYVYDPGAFSPDPHAVNAICPTRRAGCAAIPVILTLRSREVPIASYVSTTGTSRGWQLV